MNLYTFIKHQSDYLKQLAREGELQDSDVELAVEAIKAFAGSRGISHHTNYKNVIGSGHRQGRIRNGSQ